MDEAIKERLINSYQVDGGFIVHTAEQLKLIYDAYGIDPKKSTDRRLFDLESLAHFFQSGVLNLFEKLEITDKDLVLSAGEGNGSPSRLLAKVKGCKIICVDINPDQVQKAKECSFLHGVSGLVDYRLQNVEELNIPEKNFTKAYFNETSGHWQFKEKAFLAIRDHLVTGAKIGFNEWLAGDIGDLNDAYFKVKDFNYVYQSGIFFQNTIAEYKAMLEKCGFKLIYSEDCTDRVDRKMRARLIEIDMKQNPYGVVMGEEAVEIGRRYYRVMIDAAYSYVRYGVIIAEKI